MLRALLLVTLVLVITPGLLETVAGYKMSNYSLTGWRHVGVALMLEVVEALIGSNWGMLLTSVLVGYVHVHAMPHYE